MVHRCRVSLQFDLSRSILKTKGPKLNYVLPRGNTVGEEKPEVGHKNEVMPALASVSPDELFYHSAF